MTEMATRIAGRSLGLVLLLASGAATAEDRGMRLLQQSPTVNQLMSGSGTAFALRFDRPIDHQASRLTVIGPAERRVVAARLRAAPDTLYGSIGRLAPGEYTALWMAKGIDGRMLSGRIPFRVE